MHGVLRAALTQAVRWGWVFRNVASLAELSSRKVSPRKVMSAADVRRVIAAGDAIRAEVGLMLRIAAVTGARRAELAALQWTDVADGVLTVDSAIEIDRRSGRTVLSDAPTNHFPVSRSNDGADLPSKALVHQGCRRAMTSARGCAPYPDRRQ